MRLVGEHDDIVVRHDGLGVRLVELLDEREDIARIALKLLYQVLAARGAAALGGDTRQATAAFERLADLLVELIAIGEHQKCRRARLRSADLLGQENHRVTLARALRVPEDAEFSVAQLALGVGAHCLVYSQVLVIARQDLSSRRIEVIKQDEVLEEVEQRLFVTHAPQHGLERNAAGVALAQALPLAEELIRTAQRSDFGLQPVGEHHKGVVIEDLGNGVLIVGVVVLICTQHVLVVALELDEQQRHTVDEAHEVAAAAVHGTLYPQLLCRHEAVHPRMLEVEDLCELGARGAIRLNLLHWYAIAKHLVLGLVDL